MKPNTKKFSWLNLKLNIKIKKFSPDSQTSEVLINFAFKEVADLHYDFEDLINNVLLYDEEITRLLLDEAEIDRLYKIKASLLRAVCNHKEEVEMKAVDLSQSLPMDEADPEKINKLRENYKLKLNKFESEHLDWMICLMNKLNMINL